MNRLTSFKLIARKTCFACHGPIVGGVCEKCESEFSPYCREYPTNDFSKINAQSDISALSKVQSNEQ